MAETIAAIATALSASGIGIIRISGPESREITSKIYRSKGGKKDIRQVPSHTIHYGWTAPEAIQEKIQWRSTATEASLP